MSYILRYGNAGKRMCPVIGEVAGLDVHVNGDVLPKEAEYVFRWGTTAGINDNKAKVVNKITAINETCDKGKFRKKLADAGLAPKTWSEIDNFREEIGNKEFDVLIRPAMHERSEGIYRATNAWDVMDILRNKIRGEFYISEYIHKVKEFRVFVVSGRVAWVIEKLPKDKEALSWGCVEEGDFEYVGWDEWDFNVVDNALDSMSQSSLDFGAVDVIVDAEGKAYTLEVNTAPYLTEYYARKIGETFKYILKNGRDKFAKREIKNWRDALHPAIDARAHV